MWLNSQLLNTQGVSQAGRDCQTLNYLGYACSMADSETRWLTAEEQHAWRMFLTATNTLFSTVEGQLQRESGIPHGYYEILVRLSEAPGRALRMSQLANASTSSKSRLSHAVARLEERGWVERTDCETDRRGQVARLTPEGFAALEAAAPGHVEQVRRALFDPLSPDQVAQLCAIAAAIVGAADSPIGPAAICDSECGADADDVI
jgi:DNA-binding MarR family transcriptional regulator